MNLYDSIKTSITPMIPKIVTSVLIFIIFLSLANYYKNLIQPDNNLIYYQIQNIIYYSIIIFGIIFILINLGIETTTIITFLSAITITLALSFQTLLSNITASFYILFNRLFDIGDNIKVQFVSGKVTDFNLINTILIDDYNQVIHIPNNIMLTLPVINVSKK